MKRQAATTDVLISTGVVGLNDILCGGLIANRLYLIEGDPGSGKTTLGLQMLLTHQAAGGTGIYVSLSETGEELNAVAASHGWSLDGIEIIELAPEEGSLATDEENTMFHPSEVELGEKTAIVLERVERLKPQLVIFDSLSEMRLLAQNPLRYRRQILALKQFFSGRQCTVVLLDDRTATDSDLQLESIAHGVISLERSSHEYGAMQRRIQVLKMRGKRFRTGFHDYVIEYGGLVVYPRLVAAEHRSGFARGAAASGIAGLDAITGGGLDRGTSALFIGPAGTGKSTMASQFAYAAAQRGEQVALFVFDENTETYLARSTGLGIDIKRHIDSGRVVLRQVDPGELSPGQFVHYVRAEAEERNARLIVIDSLNGYLNAMPEARFLNLQMHELLTFLNQRGVTTILIVAQQGVVGSGMQAPVDVTYLADTVIVSRFFEAAGQVRQAISVVKKRSGAHERSLREMQFTADGIVIGPPLAEFQGILTGVPTYVGESGPLLKRRDGPE